MVGRHGTRYSSGRPLSSFDGIPEECDEEAAGVRSWVGSEAGGAPPRRAPPLSPDALPRPEESPEERRGASGGEAAARAEGARASAGRAGGARNGGPASRPRTASVHEAFRFGPSAGPNVATSPSHDDIRPTASAAPVHREEPGQRRSHDGFARPERLTPSVIREKTQARLTRGYSNTAVGRARWSEYNHIDDPLYREAQAHHLLQHLYTVDTEGANVGSEVNLDNHLKDYLTDDTTPHNPNDFWERNKEELEATPQNFFVQARLGVPRGKHFYGALQREPETASRLFNSLFCFRGTVLPSLLTSPILFVFVCVHIFFTLAWHYCWYGERCKEGKEDVRDPVWPKISSEASLGMGTFLVFFLTFYNGQVYNKLTKTFAHLAVIKGRLNDLAVLAIALLGRDSPHAWKIIRLANCWFHFFFYGLPHAGAGVIKWRHMVYDLRILHAEEALVLKEMQMNWGALTPWRQTTLWLIEAVKHFHNKGMVNDFEARYFIEVIIEARRNFGWLMDLDDFPIPCYYQHLMDFLVFVYSAYMAYGAIWADEQGGGFTAIGYIIMLVGVFGLRETAVKMAFPFGDDDVDLPWAEILCDLYIGHMSVLRPGTSRPIVCIERVPPMMSKLTKSDIVLADTAETMVETRRRLAHEVMDELRQQHNTSLASPSYPMDLTPSMLLQGFGGIGGASTASPDGGEWDSKEDIALREGRAAVLHPLPEGIPLGAAASDAGSAYTKPKTSPPSGSSFLTRLGIV